MHKLCRELCQPELNGRFTVAGDDFILGGKIGDGAAGLVRKAKRIKDDFPFAVKFLAPDPKYIEEAVFDDVAARFRREGERGAALRHEHLLAIYSYCENLNGDCFDKKNPANPFLLMEYIHGRTLEDHIQKEYDENGGFAITRQKLHIAIQIACALEDLHKKKLIHRDVKPANIFISKGLSIYPLVKLGDFGIMKWGDFQSSLTTGNLTSLHHQGLGTLKYMSPEQAIAPADVSVRSDMFSFGVTLFELFGSKIHAGPHNVFEVMFARLAKGNTFSRFHSLNYSLSDEDATIAGLILDMHLRGVAGRPTIVKLRGSLEWEYERRYDTQWRTDCEGY